MAATPSKVSLKLLVDTNSHKVLFAEASKDFIDFLLNTLSLPLGTLVRLFPKQAMVGSLGNLYQSVENLDESYIQPNQHKDTLLKPKLPNPNILANKQVPLLPLDVADHETPDAVVAPPPKKSFYRCGSCPYNVSYTDDTHTPCPNCERVMASKMVFVDSPTTAAAGNDQVAAGGGGEGGFVKGVVTYMVMDDLAITPLSSISCITLLNKFNVKDIGALEERLVDVGVEEGVKLLKESVQSKTVLSNVFLEEKMIKIPVNV